MANLARQYCEYFSKATEVWKRHVIREIIAAFDEYRDSVCKKLQDTAHSGPNASIDGQGIPNQEDMFSGVLGNAQQQAEQRIISALNQTLNQPPALPFPLVSITANQTAQVNPPVESATSQGDASSGQNDASVDVSIKSELNCESECECDTNDDDVQVKEEPAEEEAITGRSEAQTENDNNNFNNNRETNDSPNDHSNEAATEQESNAQAMMIDGEEEASLSYPNGLNMIAFQYSSPPSSPTNSELSINSSELIPNFSDDDQMSDDDDESASEYENDHADAEEDEPADNMDIDESELYDYRQSENDGSMIDEENSGEESDHLEDQVNMSDVEYGDEDENDEDDDYRMSDDDSTDDTTDSEDEQTAGPSTSNGRRSTRQVSKPQTVPNRPSRQQIKAKRGLLRVITKELNCTVPGCKKVVPNEAALNHHFLSAHKLKEHRCLVRDCYGKVSTSFNLECQLKNHRREVHDKVPRTNRWTCKCSKKFKCYNGLSSHYRLYHELGQFACSKAGCSFKPTSTRIKVATHMENHREGNYACPVGGCEKRFKRKGNLRQHLFTHSEERPFPCPQCGKSYKTKSDLAHHLHVHRNDISYRCTWPQCTYSAKWRASVIGHIRTVHFELPVTKKQQAEEGIEDDRDARVYVAKD